MSNEEKRRLKQELLSLKMDGISSFMEYLPPEFLSILRTDGLLRSTVSKLGAPRHVRLLVYAKFVVYDLGTRTINESGGFTIMGALSKIRTNMNYLQLRALIGRNLVFYWTSAGQKRACRAASQLYPRGYCKRKFNAGL